ncbi:MAG: AMP-binding protein, partial [Dehalococcoidia bacterium]|nr:AMP-binding protein [Dehalococcoidia bacterium]
MKRPATNGITAGDTIPDFLTRAVEKHGRRDALLFKPAFRYRRWSYSQLDAQSGQVATLLQQKGLNKGDQVVLWGPNCPQWVLAFLGCIKAGVVVVPLDLRSAPDYVSRVISRIEPKLAFTSRATPKDGVALGVPEIGFEELEASIQGMPQPEEVDISPDDLAEIMFTSGTTGDPKGVMLTHRNLLANVEGVCQYITCSPSSRLLSILPLSHMYEQMGGLFIALHYGASVTYPTSRQPTILARTMRERRVTILLLVPQALELLMNGIEREVKRTGKEALWNRLLRVAQGMPFPLRRILFRRVHKQFGGKLDFIVSGGAALDHDLGRKWEALGIKIVQGYGTTEASPVISNHSLKERRLDSAGRPLPNVELKISDEGEILVRGENVTPGYWRAPQDTEASFDGDWYKTGDLGFLDEEGFLHIQGRKKDMIVLSSGQNIFPEDIQGVLSRHPKVADSTVVGLEKGSSVEVHAALILEDVDAAEEVVSWANGQLAEQQRIRGFTIWPEEDFPRTHTLKVKKNVVLDTILGKILLQGQEDQNSGSRPAGPG